MKNLMNLLLVSMALGMVLASCSKDEEDVLTSEDLSSLSIGDFHEGGIVFYLDQTGEHGLVCYIKDFDNLKWGCKGTQIDGANSAGIGSGAQNTAEIEADCTTLGTAADVASVVSFNDFEDWFLPSKDELNEMFLNKVSIDSTAATLSDGTALASSFFYWSSTEKDKDSAWMQGFLSGFQNNEDKGNKHVCRFVRAF